MEDGFLFSPGLDTVKINPKQAIGFKIVNVDFFSFKSSEPWLGIRSLLSIFHLLRRWAGGSRPCQAFSNDAAKPRPHGLTSYDTILYSSRMNGRYICFLTSPRRVNSLQRIVRIDAI